MTLLNFLGTKRPVEELRTALAVIQEFKEHESQEEWMRPFMMWTRLEQLEDYLKLLTETDAETVSDKRAIDHLRQLRQA